MVGNHPQLSAALTNVQALNAAYAAHQRAKREGGDDEDAGKDRDRRRKKSSKRSRRDREEEGRRSSSRGGKRDKREKSSKSKRRRRRRDEDRDGKRRRRRERSDDSVSSGSSVSESSESGSESNDGRRERSERRTGERVELGRRATEALRHMLAKFPGERTNLRDVLRTIDGGRGVATAGVADEKVRNYLEYFFDNALLVKSSRTGAWALDEDELNLLSRFGAVFDESTDSLASFVNAREPWLEDEARAQEKAARAQAREVKRSEAKSCHAKHEILVGDEAHALMADQESDSEDEGREPIASEPIGPIGPAPIPEEAPARRVLGPMVPPKSMLEAAAAEFSFGDAFGPPPPELVAEIENTSNETREACATRLVRITKRGGDAYDILGVSPEDSASFIKKKYWKLSLMVHPDKCNHEDAKDAFDAIKKAHAVLSDEAQRAEVDAKRNDAKDREEFERWLGEERQKAAWRRLKGNPLPGDDELLDGSKETGNAREEWMTHLPPEARPNQGPPTANVTAFRKTEKVARTAEMVAAWTDTPQQAAQRKRQLFLQAQAQQYTLPAAVAKEQETKKLVDEFNATRRAKSLLEIHQEKQRESSRREKKEKKEKKDKRGDGSTDGTNWEYRPFDRDTDLKLKKPGELSTKEALKRAGGGLGDRFGKGGGAGGGSFL